jgi:hypothetical protein
MFGKLEARVGRPLATLLVAGLLVLAMTGSAAAALTIKEIWDGIRPKADARYLRNTKVYTTDTVLVDPASSKTVTKECPAGWQAVGGGVDLLTNTDTFYVVYSGPTVDGNDLTSLDPGRNPPATGWKVRVYNGSGSYFHDVVVGVICAR